MRAPASIRVEVVFVRECAGHLSASREYPPRAAGLPVRIEAAPIDLVAEVLAGIHGDPVQLLEGESIPPRS